MILRNIRRIAIIVSLLTVLNSCMNKEQSKRSNKYCFYLTHYSLEPTDIIIEKIKPGQKRKYKNTGFRGVSYYLGKMCIQDDKLVFYKETGVDRENLSKYSDTFIPLVYLEEIESFIKESSVNHQKDSEYYKHKNNGNLEEYVIKNYNKLPYQIINPEIGEKYHRNGWTISRNKELENARMHFQDPK